MELANLQWENENMATTTRDIVVFMDILCFPKWSYMDRLR